MKKNILVVFVMLAVALTACGPKSKKGAWVDTDKAAAKTACVAGVQAIDATADAEKVCDCAVTKLEGEFEANASVVADKATEIYNACITENKPAPTPEPAAADTTAKAAGDSTKKVEETKK